ncbi:MAG: trypsin-like serine protease [Proteobacteria bacterium]|nr:MAG: trypsin-like serine protease [Pseudomonadota bacterium]
MTTNILKSFALHLSGLGLAATLAVGCGSANDQNSESSIYGGTKTASGDWLNAVALTDTAGGVFCTGTAVTPTLVVTAGHCAEAVSSLRAIGVYVGAGKAGGAYLGQYTISKFKAHPNYQGADYDVSYVVLSKPLPLAASAYIPVVKSKAENDELMKVGKTARIVGFGQRENGDYGVKYQVDAPIVDMSNTEVAIGGSGKDSCQGDSGGPAFAKLASGEWRWVGVVSRGGSCGTGGVYGLVTANICWIQKDSGINLGLAQGVCSTGTSTASK